MIVIVPKKRIAPLWLVWFCPFVYGAIAVTTIYSIFSHRYVFLMASLLLVVLLVIIDKSFSWYKYANISMKNGYISYDVIDLVNTLGQNTTKNKVLRCERYKMRGSSLEVFGDIETTEPLRKTKKVSRIVILDATAGVVDLVANFTDTNK